MLSAISVRSSACRELRRSTYLGSYGMPKCFMKCYTRSLSKRICHKRCGIFSSVRNLRQMTSGMMTRIDRRPMRTSPSCSREIRK